MKNNQTPITELDNLMAIETFQPIAWIISTAKKKRKPLLAKSKKQKAKKVE